MIKLGNEKIAGLRLGGQGIARAYLGSGLVFDAAPAPAVYTVAVSVDHAGGGTVTGAGRYQEGESVTVRAAAADGYAFSRWTVNGQEVGAGDSYTFTVTEDVEIVAGFDEEAASRLPAGYTEVEYIQSTGGAQIDTGFVPNAGMVLTMDVQPLVQASATIKMFIASSFSSGMTVRVLFVRWAYTTNPKGIAIAAGASTVYQQLAGTTMERRTITVDYPNKKASASGGSTVNWSSTPPTFVTMPSITLLNGTADSTYGLDAKLYSCQIESDGVAARDFVPCKSPSGAVGLYDLVGEVFYGNANSVGTFMAGPAV